MKDKVRRIELHMVGAFAVISAIVAIVIMILLTNRANQNLKNYVANLIAANGRQIELNIDTYLNKIEESSSLFFAEDSFITYNKADSSLDEYDQIQIENEISDQIVNIGMMENFTDFAIIYSDDSNIGWVSKNTSKTFADEGIYNYFVSSTENDTQSGWTYTSKMDISRIYYSKRLNPNAIILVSFYGTELDDCFVIPDEFKDMTIRLVQTNNEIVYSTDSDEIGQELPNTISSLIKNDNENIRIAMDDNNLITAHGCTNGWRVVCSIPMESLMEENEEALRSSMIIVLLLAVLEILIGSGIYTFYSRKVNKIVTEIKTQADTDQMTGLLNKITFQKQVEEELVQYINKKSYAFVMIDIDFFKEINDEWGHARGDQVIINLAKLLSRTFPGEYKIGRIGGDEFAIFVSSEDLYREELDEQLKTYIANLYADLGFITRKGADDKLGISSGAIIVESQLYKYDELYNRADKMLYVSKQNGKGRVTYED